MIEKERRKVVKDSLDRLHLILDAAQLGTWEWDVDIGEVTWSEALLRMHGRRPEEFKGTLDSVLSYTHPEDREYVIAAINATLETGAPYHLEYRIITPDQDVRWLEANGRVTEDTGGQLRKFHGICMDVTERKRLYTARALLAAIVESSDDAIVGKSLDGMIQSWNAAAERLFGYTAEQALGQHISFLIPADRTAEEDDILAHVRAGQRIEHFDTVRQRRDGQLVDVSLTISPIRDEVGRIVGASKIARDITARKRTEEALRESEQRFRVLSESLEQQVAARTAELQRQTARLQRLTGELTFAEQRERKRLAAILHDDLQQLLCAAQLRLAQARRNAHDSSVLSAIESTTELLAKAIEASRTLTYQLRPPALHEGGFVSALRWLASELLKLHELHVIIDAEDMEPALSDELKVVLFESVRELLFNVAKHAGVNEATVGVHQEGERLQVLVEDKGSGFDVERAAKEKDIVDCGLGLFSTRERLAALGGDVAIASIPGAGTSIRLTVPLARAEHRQGAAPAEPFSPQSLPEAAHSSTADSPTRVVVADDYAIVRKDIANVLDDDERVQVVGEAADGVELLEAVEHYQPDLVLLDVNMPRINGVEATREIRRRWPHVRVVALSVQDDAATAKQMIRAGAAAFISKSDDLDHMIHVILIASHRPTS